MRRRPYIERERERERESLSSDDKEKCPFTRRPQSQSESLIDPITPKRGVRDTVLQSKKPMDGGSTKNSLVVVFLDCDADYQDLMTSRSGGRIESRKDKKKTKKEPLDCEVLDFFVSRKIVHHFCSCNTFFCETREMVFHQ